MLKSLLIDNFIIVDKLELDFSTGLQVLSGETGAGKSILVGAIQLSLGGKVRSGMLFDKKRPAIIETSFWVDKENIELAKLIKKYEIEIDSDEIFFCKEISTNLRGKSFINGRRVSNNIIKEFNQVLLDFHGQRDQQKLFDVEYQLELLDRYGGLEKERNKFKSEYLKIEKQQNKLRKLEKKEREFQEKIQLYKYQLNEISGFQLQPNEDAILQQEMNLLEHAEDIINTASEMEQEIYEQENSIFDSLNKFIFRLSNFTQDNKQISEAVSLLEDCTANLEDAVDKIRDIQSSIELDSEHQKEVQERFDAINLLKMKYKMNVDEILDYEKQISEAIHKFSSNSEQIQKLSTELDNNLKDLYDLGIKLSNKRKKIAINLTKELEKNMRLLAINEATFYIKFDKVIKKSDFCLSDFKLTGLDDLEFYFSANKGKEVQPLKDSASGGELSRFLLAIKKILADKLSKRAIIFDEIDTGIGGKAATLLGNYISEISHFHQVICITHLAQIAAYADKHFAICKKEDKNRTIVDINVLGSNERKKEIARMMSGSDSDIALKYANELINKKGELV